MVVRPGGAGEVAAVLRAALAPLAARVRVAFIYGSIAKGTERRASDVDVMIIGDLNAYGDEDPIAALEAAGFVDQVDARLEERTQTVGRVMPEMLQVVVSPKTQP